MSELAYIYKARKVRQKYPQELSRDNIDAIVAEWLTQEDIESVGMLYFATLYNGEEDEFSLSELELFQRIQLAFYLREMEEENLFNSLLITIYVDNIFTNYDHPEEIKPGSEDMLIGIAEEFLQELENKGKIDLIRRGVLQRKKIKADVAKSMFEIHGWKRKPNAYQKRVDKLLYSYILKDEK